MWHNLPCVFFIFRNKDIETLSHWTTYFPLNKYESFIEFAQLLSTFICLHFEFSFCWSSWVIRLGNKQETIKRDLLCAQNKSLIDDWERVEGLEKRIKDRIVWNHIIVDVLFMLCPPQKIVKIEFCVNLACSLRISELCSASDMQYKRNFILVGLPKKVMQNEWASWQIILITLYKNIIEFE